MTFCFKSSDSTSPFDGSAMASAGGSGKCSPPAVFPCPFCSKSFNEKDFFRHVKNWQGKEELVTIKSNVYPGPRNVDDHLLFHFTGSHSQRVAALIAGVRALLKPGAYDSMSPTGSGRHRAVIAHFAALMSPALPEKQHKNDPLLRQHDNTLVKGHWPQLERPISNAPMRSKPN